MLIVGFTNLLTLRVADEDYYRQSIVLTKLDIYIIINITVMC